MFVDQNKAKYFPDYKSSDNSPQDLQYKVNPRTQLRITTLSKEQRKLTFETSSSSEAAAQDPEVEKCEVCGEQTDRSWGSWAASKLLYAQFQDCESCCMFFFGLFDYFFLFLFV